MEEGNTQFTNSLTGEEIAKILHVSRAYGYQLMRQRMIPTVKIGRCVSDKKIWNSSSPRIWLKTA
jgi:excisionase family DNA binding protein